VEGYRRAFARIIESKLLELPSGTFGDCESCVRLLLSVSLETSSEGRSARPNACNARGGFGGLNSLLCCNFCGALDASRSCMKIKKPSVLANAAESKSVLT
jgi:hypothetical protein